MRRTITIVVDDEQDALFSDALSTFARVQDGLEREDGYGTNSREDALLRALVRSLKYAYDTGRSSAFVVDDQLEDTIAEW